MPDGEAVLEQLLASSPDVTLLVDEQGRITRAFGATEALFGYQPEELLDVEVERLVPAQHRRAHVAMRGGYGMTGRNRPMGTGLTVEGLRKDGTTVPLDVKLSGLDLYGRRYVAAVARDVSHLVEAQRDLALRSAQLEAMDQEKNRILGVAAHDLRNPLSALRGVTDLMQAGYLGDIDAHVPGLVERLSASVDYMVRLVDGLVDFSAIESGHLSMRLVSTDLCALIDGAIGIERLAASRRRVKLVVECDPAIGMARVDPNKFEQVLHNLVGNAVRYTPDGGEVRVAVRRDGARVHLEVDDDGPGIPDELRPLLFQPFTRGGPHTDHGEKSVGLGLAIVQRIVEGHGGKIAVESPAGGGARFTVSMPV